MEQQNLYSVDLIIPTRRGVEALKVLFKEAAKSSEWLKHTFCLVFDATAQAEAEAFRSWLSENDHLPFPKVRASFAPPQATGNLNMLRQFGLTLSNNPFVYFQDDDDPLPSGFDTRIRIMRREPYDVIFGVTETRTARGQMIERFPTLDGNGRPLYDLAEGVKLFPTYVHPCAALYRREALGKVKIDDGHNYNLCGIGAFLTRFINNGAMVQALPDVMRIGQQNRDNMSEPILDQKQRLLLAEDISSWQKYITDPVVRQFQENIRQDLINGEIITFRDITARVENRLEEDGFFLDDL